jgi:acid stress-induced BolA-like protein IbaG/YrbA
MLSDAVKKRIEDGIPNAKAMVSEFSGGTDHYSVVVIAEGFEGKALLARHRMVLDLFQAEIKTGEVHALSIQPFTPAQWESQKRT